MVSILRYHLLAFFFLLLSLYVNATGAETNLAFDFKKFAGKNSIFKSQLALYGDAKVANGSMSVQIGDGLGLNNITNGRVFCKRPFRVVEANASKKMVSFSSNFVFSSSGQNREEYHGLSFIMVPLGYPLSVGFDNCSMGMLGDKKKMKSCVAIHFYTFLDSNNTKKRKKYGGDLNGNHVRVNVESPLLLSGNKLSNVSSTTDTVIDGVAKLQAWIDYEASSKRFEVRLSKFGSDRPLDPSLTYPIDLSKMWNDSEIVLGLSSSGKNSSYKIDIYSWSFSSRTMPHWMRSHPIDPEHFADHKGKELELKVSTKSDCIIRIIVALIFGTGCGAMGAFLVLFVWTMFGDRRPVVPEDDLPAKDAVEFDHKKCNVVIVDDNKSIDEDGKK